MWNKRFLPKYDGYAASVVWCLLSPIANFIINLNVFWSFFKKCFFMMCMAAPLSTDSRYMDPSGFLPCIDCNLPDNEEILLSPRSLFVLLFSLVSFLVCLNKFSIASHSRVDRISGGRFWDVPSWKFCVKHWAAKWPSFPHLWHFIWFLSTSGMLWL